MYLRELHVRNLKLLRDVKITFTDAHGKPRPFTVFVGENGLCKTSLLQAIALAASGADRANQVADVASYPDLRRPNTSVEIDATFSFSEEYHRQRLYPGLENARPPHPPLLNTHLWIEPGFDLFNGESSLRDQAGSRISQAAARVEVPRGGIQRHRSAGSWDPLADARGRNLPHWFVAGYGVGRTLPAPASVTPDEISSPSRDRLVSLFKVGPRIIGTGFGDILPPERAEAFNAHLEQVFIEHGLLPQARALSLRARGNINSPAERMKAHRLILEIGARRVDVPTIWLSQGYQATMAWVADLVGQIWWEAEKQVVPLDDMEGICLIDEIDLHLHPRWQTSLIGALKKAFPKIQFIATTHSPMVLPGLQQDEVIRLEQDDEGNVIPYLPKEPPALMTGSELYRSFFGIERLEPRELDQKLFEYATLASYPARSADEDKKVRRLLGELRAAGVDPGFEPVPRKAAPKKRAAARKRAAAPRKRNSP